MPRKPKPAGAKVLEFDGAKRAAEKAAAEDKRRRDKLFLIVEALFDLREQPGYEELLEAVFELVPFWYRSHRGVIK